jgi:hypothetical protein
MKATEPSRFGRYGASASAIASEMRPGARTPRGSSQILLMTDYPNDSDGDALRRVAKSGSDMSKPMDIDFQIAAPNEVTAERVGGEAAKLGYRISIYSSEHVADRWTCECTRSVVPTYDTVIAVQAELDAIARPLGAHPDGWGTFGNAPRPTGDTPVAPGAN